MAMASKMKRGRMPSLSELTGTPGGRRFLFVVPPQAEHVRPTVALGAELLRRGHHVGWAGPAEVEALLDPGATLYPTDGGSTAEAMLPGVEAAIEAFGPDVVVVDQQAPAGALAARRRNLPWVTSAATETEFGRPPQDTDHLVRELTELQLRYGLADPTDLRFSDRLVLVFAVVEPVEGCPDHFAFVGAVAGTDRPAEAADRLEKIA